MGRTPGWRPRERGASFDFGWRWPLQSELPPSEYLLAFHSYWSASSTFSRDARRAGRAAARSPAPTAMSAKTTSGASGSENATPSSARACVTSPARAMPSGRPSAAPISAVITLSCRTTPGLPPRHPDRAQHPQLARALEDREHDRVHHAEQAHDHRQGEQDVEHAEQVLDLLLADVG